MARPQNSQTTFRNSAHHTIAVKEIQESSVSVSTVSYRILLHCAIFSATCPYLAMVENLALQFAEVWCWGPVTLCNFLSKLSRNAPRNKKQEVCACALVKTAVKMRDKLLEGWYIVQWCCQLLQYVAKSRAEFYWVQCFTQQKKLQYNPCYTVQFSSNLSRNGIARQVAEKITQCNRAFIRTAKFRRVLNFAILAILKKIREIQYSTKHSTRRINWRNLILCFINRQWRNSSCCVITCVV